jgi:hypothetical protein
VGWKSALKKHYMRNNICSVSAALCLSVKIFVVKLTTEFTKEAQSSQSLYDFNIVFK